MEAKSSLAKRNIAPASWQGSRSARSVLLLQMAADAEKLAAIGARIAQLRKSLRDDKGRTLTQSELAHAIHVSYRSVQNWEKGVGVRGIEPENIKALSDYFRGRGLKHATEDFIEHGVVKRERQPTPAPFTNGKREDALVARLQALETQLSQLSGKLDHAVAERTDSDAAIVQQIAALETTIRDFLALQRRRRA